MKKLLILLLLVSGFAKAQIPAVPGYTGINSGYIWYKGGFQQLNLPAYGDTALQPGQWRRAGAVLVDTSGSNKGLYFWMDGKWNLVAAGALAVTNIATNNGSGIVGGPITSTGTLAIDTLLTIATKDWVNSQGFGSGGGGSGVVSAGAQYRLAYYAATGTTVSESGAITGDRALISDVNGVPTHAAVTATELNYLSGVTSALQTQINAKGAGTVTSVATNTGSGITGGTITGTGTLAIDTASTIQKKLSYTAPITKNNNTLSLSGWSSTLPNSVYGADASGVGIMRRAAIIDTALRHNGWSVVWDSVNLKHVYQYITGSGSGSTYVPPKLLQFIIGSTPNAPVAGTNTVTHDSAIGKFMTIYRDEGLQYYNKATNGYTFVAGTGTATVDPPWVDGEAVDIYITSSAPDTLSAQPIPASWVDVTYPTQTGLTESPSKVWTGTNSSFGSQGLSGSTLTGTGWYIFKSGSPGSNANGLIGFKTTNSNGDYTTYNFGVYLSEESGHLRVNRVDGGAATAVSGAVYGVGYINYGDYAGVFRDVATGVVTLRTSADKITWTTSYTFGSTSTATLYMLMNPFSGTAIYQPQYKVGP